MNRKAQVGLGSILVVFISVIVGLTLFLTIAQTTGVATSTLVLANVSMGTVTNGTTVYLTDYRSITSPVVFGNGTPLELAAGNYTLTNNVIDPTTGGLSVRIVPSADTYSGTPWIISGTGQATDYIADSAARSITALIAIFFALGVAVIVLAPVIKEGLGGLGK